MEHKKTEVFYFSRSHRVFEPPPLDFMPLGDPILQTKNTWQYLGFIFVRKLIFQQHIDFYANKTISTIKCLKMLRNLSRELISTQKQLLYRSCVLPIFFYSFQLWYYNKVLLFYPLKELRKIQRRATIWILRAFHISSTLSIKVITRLIPIHLHLQKLSSRSQLRVHSLPSNYIIKSLLEVRHSNYYKAHWLLLERLTPR